MIEHPLRTTLDPRLDVVFKLLFGHPDRKDILISLISAVLSPPKPITSLLLRYDEIKEEKVDDAGATFDIWANLDELNTDIGMQIWRKSHSRNRALYYWSENFMAQLREEDSYEVLRPMVSIFFLDFRELNGYVPRSMFRIREEHGREVWSEAFQLYTIELPKLLQSSALRSVEDTPLQRWGTFLAAESDQALREVAEGDEMVTKALDRLKELSADKGVRELVGRREMALSTYRMGLGTAEAMGMAKGILAVLDARGVALSGKNKAKVLSCRSHSQLEKWIRCAASAHSERNLFSG